MSVWSDPSVVGCSLRSATRGSLVAFVMLAPVGSGAAFDPPRIVHVVNLSSRGTAETAGVQRLYHIDKGQETNIASGDTLNVYRERTIARSEPQPMRIFVGTLTITDTQEGSALGAFNMNEAADRNHALRHKSAMKGDFVIPRLVLDSNVLFDAGSADLRSAAEAEFVKVANFIRFHAPSKLVVEGHTDADGDDIYNKKLSKRRAEAVRQLLVSGYDFITEDMIVARGYGEEHPREKNDTEVNKALNRRIEVLVWWEDLEERIDARTQGLEEELLEQQLLEQQLLDALEAEQR